MLIKQKSLFMTERAQKYLSDILRAIDLISSFLEDINSFAEYESDYKTQSAVERQLGIVGEAVNQFRKECPNNELGYTKEIVGFRNRIIHSYDSVDNSMVWVIVMKYLPLLKDEIGSMGLKL